MVKYIVSIILIFLYLFPVNLTFFPSSISTRWFLFIPGVFLFVSKKYHSMSVGLFEFKERWKYFRKHLIWFYAVIISFGFLNGCFDGVYSVYPITLALVFFSSLFLIYILKYIWDDQLSFTQYLWLFVLTVFAHQILALLMFFIPELNDIVFSVIRQTAREEDANLKTMLTRFHTIGVAYFGAGILYALSLISIMIISQSAGKIVRILLPVLFVLIFAIGSAIARTTQVGLFFAVLYLIFSNSSFEGIFIKKIFKYTIISVFTVTVALLIFLKYIENNDFLSAVIQHAFEGIYNIINEGKYSTTSSDKMFDNYKYPDNLWTWIFGDARLNGEDEYSYYMHTDIGWCRLIFDFGIVGLVLFMYMQLKFLRIAFNTKMQAVTFMGLLVACTFKGITDLIPFLMPQALLWMFIDNKQEKI